MSTTIWFLSVVAILCGAALIATAGRNGRNELDQTPRQVGGVVCIGLGLIAVLFLFIVRHEDASCARMLAHSQTHADSFAVQMRCELGDGHISTVPIVVPVVVR